MTEPRAPKRQFSGSGRYEFRVEGHLPDKWERWFEGLSIARDPGGTTTLRGMISDQSALHSVLLKIRNINLNLISVNRITDDRQGET